MCFFKFRIVFFKVRMVISRSDCYGLPIFSNTYICCQCLNNTFLFHELVAPHTNRFSLYCFFSCFQRTSKPLVAQRVVGGGARGGEEKDTTLEGMRIEQS